MRGFTSFSYNGHPCFIREEYEEAHNGENEFQRLEDALGITFSDFNTAMYYCMSHARHLLYRLESDEIDCELLRGRDPWVKFRDGYVHVVTGEYVLDVVPPTYDSYPCWKIEEPAGTYFDPHSALQISGIISLGVLVFSLLAKILGMNNNEKR